MKSGSVLLGFSILVTMPLRASVVVAEASVESGAKTTMHSAEADELRVIESPGYRIVLPSSRSFHTEEERSTPWGKATVRSEAARRSGITYIFSTYVFDGDRRIPAKQVAKTKDAFLKSHKCTATVLKTPPIKTADGNAWPQSAFRGTCAATGDYEIRALIVDGRLYEFQVTNDPADLTQSPSTTTASTIVPAPHLHEALVGFLERSRLSHARD